MMKLLATLAVMAAALLPALGATPVYPASTNATAVQTLFGNYTFANAVLSTSASSNAPSALEFPTASWVRGLFNNGVLDYATTNIVAGATNNDTAGQPVYAFSSTIPLSASRSYVNPAVGTYVGAVMTTNTFTFLQGPIEVNAYMTITTGGGDALAIHPELYYSYDKTNWYGDFEAQQQSIIGGSTNLYQFVISFPAITATNSSGFYIERRLKVHSKGGSPTLTFLVGTNIASGVANASHISFSGPNSGVGNAYLANDQTFTGSNYFNGPVSFGSTVSAGALSAASLVVSNAVTLTNAGNLFGGDGVLLTNLSSGSFRFTYTNNVIDSATNWICDLASGKSIYRSVALTNNMCFLYSTNGAGACSWIIRPGTATNPVVSIPTAWIPTATNSWTLNGSYWQYTLTNAAGTVGPRVMMLSVLNDTASTQTNTVWASLVTP